MSKIAIEFENISKQYRLGTIGTGTLSLTSIVGGIRSEEKKILT